MLQMLDPDVHEVSVAPVAEYATGAALLMPTLSEGWLGRLACL
jgi:hypothetical protein